MLRHVLYSGAITLDIGAALWGIYHHNPWGAGICSFMVGVLFTFYRRG